MYTPASKYSHNNEIKMDVKFNSSISYAAIMCRSSGIGGTYMGLLYNPTGGSAYNGFGIGLISTFSLDESQGIHHFDINCNDNTFEVIEDGNIKYNGTSSLFETVGDNSVLITFGGGGNDNEFANFQMCDLNGCSSPTPTPNPIQLGITPLKQTDTNWKDQVYDSANIWSPGSPTIGSWGCALTSAAMVLNYYNIHNLPGPSSTPLNPGTLNTWLKNQPDGYIGSGLINWLALQRLTKQAKANNPSFPFDALVYNRINSADTTTLLADLQNNQPDILEEPGHFVVASGENSSNIFTINDPYFNRTLLSSYGNSFNSLGRYIPSFTDLSYILFTFDPSLTLTLSTASDSAIGTSFTQQPLSADDTTGLLSGSPVEELYLQQPGNGNYNLTVSGSTNQNYSVTGYMYDINGELKQFTITGNTGPSNQVTIPFNFNSQNLGTIVSDLNYLNTAHLLSNGTYNSLKSIGNNITKDIQNNNTNGAKALLTTFITLLKAHKIDISNSAFQIILSDVQYLQSHL